MRILFYGDSVTDCGRDRNDLHSLGGGYPALVAEQLAGEQPGEGFEFINKGVSGNRTRDLLARLEPEVLPLKPDVAIVLIGINDVWRRYDSGEATSEAAFEANYEGVLRGLKACGSKIILLEPFLLYTPDKPYREDLNPKIDIVRKLALRYADCYVPLDGIFTAQAVLEGGTALSADAVHPTARGAALIAGECVRAILRVTKGSCPPKA
jgi:lysophospholipase L1-like esterase